MKTVLRDHLLISPNVQRSNHRRPLPYLKDVEDHLIALEKDIRGLLQKCANQPLIRRNDRTIEIWGSKEAVDLIFEYVNTRQMKTKWGPLYYVSRFCREECQGSLRPKSQPAPSDV